MAKKEEKPSPARQYADIHRLGLLVDGRGEAFKKALGDAKAKFTVAQMNDGTGVKGEVITVERFKFVIEL